MGQLCVRIQEESAPTKKKHKNRPDGSKAKSKSKSRKAKTGRQNVIVVSADRDATEPLEQPSSRQLFMDADVKFQDLQPKTVPQPITGHTFTIDPVSKSAIESFRHTPNDEEHNGPPADGIEEDDELYKALEEYEDGESVQELRSMMNARHESLVDAMVISEVPYVLNIQLPTQQQAVKENRRLQFGVLNFVHWWLDGVGCQNGAAEVTAIFQGGRHSQLTGALLKQNEKLLLSTETRLGGGRQRHRHASSHSTHSTLVSNPLRQKSFVRDGDEKSDEVLSFFDELEEDRVRSTNTSSS